MIGSAALRTSIESPEQADGILRLLSIALWILTALNALLAVGNVALGDVESAGGWLENVVPLAAFAWFLPRRRSRALAVTMLLGGVFLLVEYLACVMHFVDEDAGTPVGAIALLLASAWALRACFGWHRLAQTRVAGTAVVLVALFAVLWIALAYVASMVGTDAAGFSDDAQQSVVTVAVELVAVAAFAGLLPGTRRSFSYPPLAARPA